MLSTRQFMIVMCAVIPISTCAAEINDLLKCTVQSITYASVSTNQTESVEVRKETPTSVIGVIYARNKSTGFVIEKYGYRTDFETTTIYSKGYSAGGTQYISKNGESVITYFGKQDEHHIIVKYSRMQRKDGSALAGFRHDSYANAFMYCVRVE